MSSEAMLVLFLVSLSRLHTAAVADKPFVEKLLQERNYSPDMRPVKYKADPVNVSVALKVLQIDNLDLKREHLHFFMSLMMQWEDQFLTWNNSEQTDMVILGSNRIWTPRVRIENEARPNKNHGEQSDIVQLFWNGTVVLWIGRPVETECPVDIDKYPFDVQRCKVALGLMQSMDDQVQLKVVGEFLPKGAKDNGQFKVEAGSVLYKTRLFNGKPYTRIIYEVILARKSLRHVTNVIVPIFVIALLNLLTFTLPAETEVKVSLSLSIFLAYVVMLKSVTSSIPETSDGVSVLGRFVLCQLITSAITVAMSVVSINLHSQSEDVKPAQCWLCLMRMCARSSGVKKSNRAAKSQGNELQETETVINFQTISRHFDRLLFIISLTWQVALSVGIYLYVSVY